MNIVRGCPTVPCGPDGAAPMRVPHAPQNANPTWTGLPQFGQRELARREPGRRSACDGAGVVTGWMPPPVARGAGAGPASGLGGS